MEDKEKLQKIEQYLDDMVNDIEFDAELDDSLLSAIDYLYRLLGTNKRIYIFKDEDANMDILDIKYEKGKEPKYL